MSTQATASVGQPAYDAFSPHPMKTVTAQRLADEQGRKCARCGKPQLLSGAAGGCACPRHWAPDGTDATLTVHKTLDERRVEALETLARVGLAFARSMNVEVPPAEVVAAAPAAGPVGLGGAAEAIRAADQKRKVS